MNLEQNNVKRLENFDMNNIPSDDIRYATDRILERIRTGYDLALASSDKDQEKGIRNFYHTHLSHLWYTIPAILRDSLPDKYDLEDYGESENEARRWLYASGYNNALNDVRRMLGLASDPTQLGGQNSQDVRLESQKKD